MRNSENIYFIALRLPCGNQYFSRQRAEPDRKKLAFLWGNLHEEGRFSHYLWKLYGIFQLQNMVAKWMYYHESFATFYDLLSFMTFWLFSNRFIESGVLENQRELENKSSLGVQCLPLKHERSKFYWQGLDPISFTTSNS